ncbi:MAG: NAD-dependent epimerase/dehydratase family protein [Pirellulales bacterium]
MLEHRISMQASRTIVIAGGGGFIGGALAASLARCDGVQVRSVDCKPLSQWYQRPAGVECVVLDLRDEAHCRKACRGASEVYNLAADMGGMGFIERFRIECMRSVLINTHLIEAAQAAGVERYFFASSACVYNTALQTQPGCPGLKESDAYPALAERGYGWEKLFSEMLCQEYWHERGLKTFIARFHNVYGPHGTWDGGREKAPAAVCRNVIAARERGEDSIVVWGDGTQTRSFTYIDDCIEGIRRIVADDRLVATPLNLGSSEMVSINQLVDLAESFADVKIRRLYKLDAPQGVAGRNSDNTLIRRLLDWEPRTSLAQGLARTFSWIEQEYRRVHAQPQLQRGER